MKFGNTLKTGQTRCVVWMTALQFYGVNLTKTTQLELANCIKRFPKCQSVRFEEFYPGGCTVWKVIHGRKIIEVLFDNRRGIIIDVFPPDTNLLEWFEPAQLAPVSLRS